MTTRYFEDFAAGDRWEFGDWALEEREMVAFATEHDPQPIHIDLAYGAASPYGSIIASGWLTMLKCIRPYIDGPGYSLRRGAVRRGVRQPAGPGQGHLPHLRGGRPGAGCGDHPRPFLYPPASAGQQLTPTLDPIGEYT
jgi:hypothetical protein